MLMWLTSGWVGFAGSAGMLGDWAPSVGAFSDGSSICEISCTWHGEGEGPS